MVPDDPSVTIRLIGILRQVAGVSEVCIPLYKDDTIGSILNRLVARLPVLNQELYNEKGQFHGHLNIFVDDQPVLLQNLGDYPIQRPVNLTILMAVGGG